MKFDIALLTPIADEYSEISRIIDIPVQVKGAKRPAISGKIGSFTVICMLLGKGEARAASTVQYIFDIWKPRWVILTGVAGGSAKNGVFKGDVVIAKYIYGIDFGKIENGRFIRRPEYDLSVDEQMFSYAEVFSKQDLTWRNKIGLKRPDNEDNSKTSIHFGYILSGDKVIDDINHNYFKEATKDLEEYHAIEMESVGAGACVKLEQSTRAVGFFVVRGISDLLEASSEIDAVCSGSMQRKQWKSYASSAVIAFVHSFINFFEIAISNDIILGDTIPIELVIDYDDLEKFNEPQEKKFIANIKELLKINGELKIISKRKGSVTVTLNLPQNTFKQLKKLSQEDLLKYKIIEADIDKRYLNTIGDKLYQTTYNLLSNTNKILDSSDIHILITSQARLFWYMKGCRRQTNQQEIDDYYDAKRHIAFLLAESIFEYYMQDSKCVLNIFQIQNNILLISLLECLSLHEFYLKRAYFTYVNNPYKDNSIHNYYDAVNYCDALIGKRYDLNELPFIMQLKQIMVNQLSYSNKNKIIMAKKHSLLRLGKYDNKSNEMLMAYVSELFNLLNNNINSYQNKLLIKIILYHVYNMPHFVNIVEFILTLFLAKRISLNEHNFIRIKCGKPPIVYK